MSCLRIKQGYSIMRIPFFLILISCLLIISCDKEQKCPKYTEDYYPSDINEAILFLECELDDETKNKFTILPESDVIDSNYELQEFIINRFGLWDQESKLRNSFIPYKISHVDNISSFILISLHRKLNNKEIALDQQIENYKIAFLKEKEKNKKIECPEYTSDYYPKNINEAILFFECDMPEYYRATFQKESESEVANNYVLKLHIERKLERFHTGKEYLDYPTKFGIKNYELIPRIIVVAIHRKLNNKKINLEQLIEKTRVIVAKENAKMQIAVKKDKEEYAKLQAELKQHINSFKINDTVQFDYNIDWDHKDFKLMDFLERNNYSSYKAVGIITNKQIPKDKLSPNLKIKLIYYGYFSNLYHSDILIEKGTVIDYNSQRHNLTKEISPYRVLN